MLPAHVEATTAHPFVLFNTLETKTNFSDVISDVPRNIFDLYTLISYVAAILPVLFALISYVTAFIPAFLCNFPSGYKHFGRFSINPWWLQSLLAFPGKIRVWLHSFKAWLA